VPPRRPGLTRQRGTRRRGRSARGSCGASARCSRRCSGARRASSLRSARPRARRRPRPRARGTSASSRRAARSGAAPQRTARTPRWSWAAARAPPRVPRLRRPRRRSQSTPRIPRPRPRPSPVRSRTPARGPRRARRRRAGGVAAFAPLRPATCCSFLQRGFRLWERRVLVAATRGDGGDFVKTVCLPGARCTLRESVRTYFAKATSFRATARHMSPLPVPPTLLSAWYFDCSVPGILTTTCYRKTKPLAPGTTSYTILPRSW
jgi:hypothetical protein